MGTGDIMLGGGGVPCDGLASHSEGSRNISSRLMLRISSGSVGRMTRGFPFFIYIFLYNTVRKASAGALELKFAKTVLVKLGQCMKFRCT